ncbi:MAG: RHS repeat-associated core domain-containing protein, partial [Chloroflexota bacterium]
TLTLGSAKTLERVELNAVSNYLPSTYVVEALSGSTWVQVASGTNADFLPYDSSYRAVKSFAAVSTTGLRVRFTGAVNSGVVWLTELQVWSTNGSSTQRFDAWGNQAGSTGSSIPMYGFTGRESDASGLVFMRARYYSAQFGRFISRDPIGLQGGISSTTYADGNPISNNDPSGLIANSVSNTVTNYAGQVGNSISGFVSGLDVVGAADQFGRKLAYDFVQNNQPNSGYLVTNTWLANKLTPYAQGYDGGTTSNGQLAAGLAVGASLMTPGGVEGRTASESTALARQLGREGEAISGIVAPKIRIPSASETAAYRVPDELTSTTLRDAKNVSELRWTNQLNDFAVHARDTARDFVLDVRENTVIGRKAQEMIDKFGVIVNKIYPPKP